MTGRRLRPIYYNGFYRIFLPHLPLRRIERQVGTE